MSPKSDGQTLEHLQVAISDALLSLEIHVPSNLFASQLENNEEALSRVQRLIGELRPESVTTFHDAFSFAHSIGFDLVDGTNANIAISELMYFLAIELQTRKLLETELPKEKKKPNPHTEKVEPSHTAANVDDDVSGFHLSPASQQLLDFISCTLRQDYQNRADLITLRLKLTAESFLEKETAEPLTESQEKLNNLIQSIQNDESCLLSTCQDSNDKFGLINTYQSSEENNNNLGEQHDKIPSNAFVELNSQNSARIESENQLGGTLPYKKKSSRPKRYQERKENHEKNDTSQRVQNDQKLQVSMSPEGSIHHQGGKHEEMPNNKLAKLTIRSHDENFESKNLVETSPRRTKSFCANDPPIDSNGQLPTTVLKNDDVIIEPNSLVESLPRKTKSRRANNRQKNAKGQVAESQEKLNSLIQSIQNDESCLLSTCQVSNDKFGFINTYQSSEENNNNLGEQHDKIPTNTFVELDSQNSARIESKNQLDGTLPYKKKSNRSKRYQERKDNRQKYDTLQRVQHDQKLQVLMIPEGSVHHQGGKHEEMPNNEFAELNIRSHGENFESKNLVETSPQRTKSFCANDPQIDSNGQLPTTGLENDDVIIEPNSLVESLPRKTKSRRANNRQKNVKGQVGPTV